VTVDNSLGAIAIEIEESLLLYPIHHIRFIMPGFVNIFQKNPYQPSLIEFLKDFQVFRFMDWLKTNNSTSVWITN